MRRTALLGLILLLPGCSGFGEFLGDTLTLNTNPNRPAGDSANMVRVLGGSAELPPLTPETGNIWPTSIPEAPTLLNVMQDQNNPDFRPPPGPQPQRVAPPVVSSTPPPGPPQVFQTPRGPAVSTGGTGNYQTIQTPGGGGNSIVVPNGNGTSTVIAPDGSVTTIPTPK